MKLSFREYHASLDKSPWTRLIVDENHCTTALLQLAIEKHTNRRVQNIAIWDADLADYVIVNTDEELREGIKIKPCLEVHFGKFLLRTLFLV